MCTSTSRCRKAFCKRDVGKLKRHTPPTHCDGRAPGRRRRGTMFVTVSTAGRPKACGVRPCWHAWIHHRDSRVTRARHRRSEHQRATHANTAHKSHDELMGHPVVCKAFGHTFQRWLSGITSSVGRKKTATERLRDGKTGGPVDYSVFGRLD